MSNVCRQTFFIEEFVNVKCCICDGDHITEFPECSVRVNEVDVSRIRTAQQISYVEEGQEATVL
jgi:hypothetical protein